MKEVQNEGSVGSRRGLTGGVTLTVNKKMVVMDNGILQVTLSNPKGLITGIQFGGLSNVLEFHNKESNRGYWDIDWNAPGYRDQSEINGLQGQGFQIIKQNGNEVEISFVTTWIPSTTNSKSIPINIDLRYVMLQGSSGFYSYAILERKAGWPATNIGQIRAVYKLLGDKFIYMAISDKIQREMPSAQDVASGMPLAYKEAVLLTNPKNKNLTGQVEDKYQYSIENKDNKLQGWISYDPPIGFWLINPSSEYYSGGPFKQDLTSHVGPTCLDMFLGGHYAGTNFVMQFQREDAWKKVFGPSFIHLNSVSKGKDPLSLWVKAKQQLSEEVGKWPYDFPSSTNFLKANQRGSIQGTLLVNDKYVSETLIPAKSAWVGLAEPGEARSWQKEPKGYQFWAQADETGEFRIEGIREGNYSLYARVPGFIGDYKYAKDVQIKPGDGIQLGKLVYEPPRNGPTLWEIGVPDHSAAEFFVPDPNPNLTNRVFLGDDQNKFRQYGLWDRYTDLYPKDDLIYTIGVSNYHKDWFFAHVTRRKDKSTNIKTTWKIVFTLEGVKSEQNFTLQLALASAHESELQVRFNNPDLSVGPHFTTKLIGKDNAIARHGVHGLYWLFSVNVSGSWLRQGSNTIYLTQTRDTSPFRGLMYDYIRLEGPPKSNNVTH